MPFNPPHFLRGLRSRNYRLYFSGQCVSLLGNWMTFTASLWLAYHLSGSPFCVGLIGFANQFPTLILAPFAGVWIDRVDGMKLVQLSQALGMLQSAALAAFALSGHITVGWLIGLCFCQGAINALDFPSRQALTYRLAEDRALLDNVIALNSITFNIARFVGPALAGFFIAAWGPGACFTLDAVSYLAVLGALFAVRLAPQVRRANPAHPAADLREGLVYAWNHPAIRRVLLLVPAMALVAFGFNIVAPVLARTAFSGDARVFGLLMAAAGAGALAAGIALSLRPARAELAPIVVWGAAIAGAGLIVIALPFGGLPLALAGFAAAGMGAVLVMLSCNILLQWLVDDAQRGRVLSLFTVGQGFFPIGSLLVGALAQGVGSRWAMLVCGAACLAIAAVFSRHVEHVAVPAEPVPSRAGPG